MKADYKIVYDTTALNKEEEYLSATLCHLSELYYSGADMEHPTAEYFRGVLSALFHTDKLIEAEYDIYCFMIDKMRERRRKS